MTSLFGDDFADPDSDPVEEDAAEEDAADEATAEAFGPGQTVLREVLAVGRQTIEHYCLASAEYVRQASLLDASQARTTQIALSGILGRVLLEDLRDALPGALLGAIAGETKVGGGLREVKADVSEMTNMDGLTLGVELKPVHLAVGRAIWNRFGDIRTFAVNIHLKFPFAVVGGVMTLPTQERMTSGQDDKWKGTTHLVERAVSRFIRAGGRETEGGAAHLLEGIAVVVFDHETGAVERDLPPAGTGLRWPEFVAQVAAAYDARFGAI